ncbi:MAG TPA: PAS domain S-box protein [Hydrogenophaga sp.]|uniref:sensor histidine kinase n=1 Tax=Hydrogenophaga sp. TaxID=1904254 RepID=UPI002C36E081|nr:PAS domain S-box protein [Hydrogenophaga sp.]HMN93828.1 PAS domain S-box protein [Hydrogenophaga sp.]HMP11276.1 PAS domain S-box protein [Hydrogenophaga sp.]
MPTEFPRLLNSLRLQLVVLIGALAMASAVPYVMVTSRMVAAQIEQDRFKLQRLLAIRMASRLTQDMVARANGLQFLAGLEVLRDPTAAAEDKQALLMTKQAAFPIYAWIGLTDATGRIVASTEPRINGLQVSDRAWFEGGRRGLHFEDVHDAVLLGQLLPRPRGHELPLRLIDIALPLKDGQGRFLGVLAAHLSLDWAHDLQAYLLAQVAEPALEMVLVNRSGEVFLGHPGLPASAGDLSGLGVVKEAQAGRTATAIETWPDGRRYLSAAAPALESPPFPGLGWSAVVRMDEGVALAESRHLAWLTLVIGLSAAFGFSWVIWWTVGHRLRPLEKLSDAAASITADGTAPSLPEPEGKDEVAVFTRTLTRLVNALRESRLRFQGLFEHAPVAMVFADRSGQILNTNSRFEHLFGAGAAQLAHMDRWFESAFPDGAARDKARQRWARVVAMPCDSPVELSPAEYDIRRTDGSRRTVEASGIAMIEGILVAFHDQTEKRRAEAGLRLWVEAFERSEVSLLITDARTNTIEGANPAFARRRGYTPEELRGMPFMCLFPASRSADMQAVVKQLESQSHLIYESEHITRDGHIFPVLVDVTVLHDTKGQAVRRVAYIQDLTEQRRAAQEILRLNAELEQRVVERTAELSAANRELDSFAASVSHDLRAPLRNIGGLAHLLRNEFSDQLGDEGCRHVQRIEQGTRHMGELIEGLLALSQTTQKPLEREPVNLSAIASRRLAELAAAEPARTVSVHVEPDLVADCDPRLAEALMVNLLDNAWKYSGKTARAEIRFCLGEIDGLQGFCVSDNGAGFDMAQATHLFEPFQRLHRASDFAGTGVGLATVHRIVDRHGGRIVARAPPGLGATFCFTLRP